MFVAVLSTTVLPLDGVYKVKTINTMQPCSCCMGEGNIYPSSSEVEVCRHCSGTGIAPIDLIGIPHYIGHPDTKAIVESLGAVPAPTKLFSGLQIGEKAVCFPIAQEKSTRAVDGFTSPHQDVDLSDLQIRVITRLE